LISFPFLGDQIELLSELVGALDDEDLRMIARLDRGKDFDDHLAKLRRMKASGLDGFVVDGYLVEVLNLCAWSEPFSDGDIRRLHRQRVFCCGLIYGSGTTPSDRFYTDETTLIQFVESLIALGHSRKAIIGFFAWLLSDADRGDVEEVFICIVLLSFALQEKQFSNSEILTLIDWIMMAGDVADMTDPVRWSACGWDFGIDERGRFNAKWRALLASLSRHVRARHGPSVEEGVALLISMALPAVTEYAWAQGDAQLANLS